MARLTPFGPKLQMYTLYQELTMHNLFSEKSWVSERRTIYLPGLTIERHRSAPNALDYAGHDCHLLCLLLSDGNRQKLVRIGDRISEKPQAKGSFWICPAQTSGTWVWNSHDCSLMVAIEPQRLAETADGLNTNKVELLSTINATDPQIDAIVRLFQAELDTSGMGGLLYAESLAQVLIVHLLRNYCAFEPTIESTVGLTPRQRQRILDYIHSSLDKPLRLAELASVVGMSQYYFCRLFKQTFGIAPYQYVLQQRMERAKSLLLKRKYTIAEIASMVGCPDQSRFTKHFKKHIGITPRTLLSELSTAQPVRKNSPNQPNT